MRSGFSLLQNDLGGKRGGEHWMHRFHRVDRDCTGFTVFKQMKMEWICKK
jgi:hypothetical protein